MIMMVRVAPIRMPRSGEIGRSPSEAEMIKNGFCVCMLVV